VAERPEGYHDIPEADQKKAKVFFDYARTADGTGNYEYAIDMMLQGLAVDPDARAALITECGDGGRPGCLRGGPPAPPVCHAG